jgi:hypothetical protein
MRRTAATLPCALLAAALLGGCGSGSSSADPAGAASTKVIDVTFDGDSVDPTEQ